MGWRFSWQVLWQVRQSSQMWLSWRVCSTCSVVHRHHNQRAKKKNNNQNKHAAQSTESQPLANEQLCRLTRYQFIHGCQHLLCISASAWQYYPHDLLQEKMISLLNSYSSRHSCRALDLCVLGLVAPRLYGSRLSSTRNVIIAAMASMLAFLASAIGSSRAVPYSAG